MKRKIVTSMAAVLVCAAVMTGCGSKAADDSSDKSRQTEEAKILAQVNRQMQAQR